MQEAMYECWGSFTSRNCKLFAALSNDILWESGRGNQVGSQDIADDLWRSMPDDDIFHKRRYKVNNNRFWHGIEVGWVYAANWTKLRIAHTYMALESDALKGSAMTKLMFKHDGSSLTAGVAVSAEEKALQGKLNALTVSVMFFSDKTNLGKLRAMLTIAKPVETWYRLQSHTCRSVDSNARWVREQLGGAFMKHIVDVFQRCVVLAIPTL